MKAGIVRYSRARVKRAHVSSNAVSSPPFPAGIVPCEIPCKGIPRSAWRTASLGMTSNRRWDRQATPRRSPLQSRKERDFRMGHPALGM